MNCFLHKCRVVEMIIPYDSSKEKKNAIGVTLQIPHLAGNDTTLASLPAFFDAKNQTQNAQIPFIPALDTKSGKSGICVHHF